MASCLISLLFFWASLTIAFASFDNPIQDFCVADLKSPVRVNGLACKDPKLVDATDFLFSGLQHAANTSNPYGVGYTVVTVGQLPGLYTQGTSLIRADFAPSGVVAPHIHHRSSEVVTILKGSVMIGFVVPSQGNRQISRVLKKGDVFVVPQGLVHFLENVGNTNAIALALFSSPNPGFIGIADAVFGSKPDISTHLLAKAFLVDEKIIAEIQSKF